MNDHPGSAVLDKLLEEARPEQKAAVTANEPIVVVGAGAGTGKTKTLAWRFLWALLAFPETRVENILTLTFTEKAAREMRERIAAMLESARKDAEALGLEDEASRLSDARSRLDEAYISTIHAFALRVIRESGLTLPLDPGAGLVSPPQEEAFWEAFRSILDSLDPHEAARGLPEPWRTRAGDLADSPELAGAVNSWGPEALASFAREAVALHGSRGMTPEALWEWDPCLDEAVRARLLAENAPLWEDRLTLFRGTVFPGLGDLSRDKTQLGKKLDDFHRRWGDGPAGGETPERLLEFLEDLDSTLKGASGKLKDVLAGLMDEPPAAVRKALEKELPLARSLVGGLSDEEKAARKTAARTAAVAWARWEQAKAGLGTLTFDDLIRYAAGAVSANPSYGTRFRHILVDEVQDTDPLQDALIEALRESGRGRLFMVGDLKQSIYRFRHAEPSLFAGRIRRAAGGNGERYVLLDRSYRMRQDLVRFVNGWFGALWSDGLGRALGVDYEALVGPSDAPWWEGRNALETPAVSLLLETHREDPESEEKEKKPAVRGRLAGRLAAQLAALRGKLAWDKKGGTLRPLEWRDMAVLVPGRTHYPSLQEAFEAAGIPAVFQKSQGFFSRGEVFDLVGLLRALAEPDDRLALGGWLVSPFSGLCKEEALRLAGVPEKGNPPLRARLESEFPLTAERFGKLRAAALLAGPAAVLEALLEDPAALKTAPPPDRPRMAANLARAAALAREFSTARGPSLAACAAALAGALREALPAEEPDFMAEDEDVVRVMTVHAAKGLEFPVVAVMGLDDAGRGNGKGGPLVPSVPLVGVTTSLPGDEAPPAQAVLWHRALEKGALEEESERLFYVAATRAQDVLLLCGICPLDKETGEARPGEGSWLSMLAASHPLLVEGALRQASEGTEPSGKPSLRGSPEPAPSPGTELELPGSAPTLASVSATGYALYSHCPRAWRLQVRQGLELSREKPESGEPGGPDLGSLAHRILAQWDFSPESLDTLLPGVLEGPTDRALLRLPPELRAPARRDGDRAALRAILGAFLETPAGKDLATAHRQGILKREWPFRLPLEGGPVMAGVLDALWEENGTLHVRDYKLAAPGSMDGLGTAQLAFYGTVLLRLFPGRALDLSLLFLRTNGEVPVPAGSIQPERVEGAVRAMAREGVTGPFPPNREACPACPWRAFCGYPLKWGHDEPEPVSPVPRRGLAALRGPGAGAPVHLAGPAPEAPVMPVLLLQILVFGAYTLALVFLAGEAFNWKEDRRLFYVGGNRITLVPMVGTFVATWMSAASVLGYTMWLYADGYVAFTGSVNGWLIGLVFMPFIVRKLRASRALSLPQWLGDTFGDPRLRSLSALALIGAYTFYMVIQFRAFGTIVATLLDIKVLVASALVYLFVLYTTFGGLPSVARSDTLNLALIVGGVTLAAVTLLGKAGSLGAVHAAMAARAPEMLHPWTEGWSPLVTTLMMLSWGLGVAANPQYAIRLLSARTTRDAYNTLALSSLIIGAIYAGLTVLGLSAFVLFPGVRAASDELAFTRLFSLALPPVPALALFLAVLAAAVSTANSQLLLAACSLCYDLRAREGRNRGDLVTEDRFLFKNRLAIAGIATAALALSQFRLPGVLLIGRYSWTVVAICFFLPLYVIRNPRPRALFVPLSAALLLHLFLTVFMRLLPELALLPALALEGLLYFRPWRKEP